MRAVFLDRGTFPENMDFPTPTLTSDWICYPETSSAQLYDHAKDADIIVTNKVILDSSILRQLTNLKMVQVTATGTNNIDHDYLASRQIPVQNVTGYSRYALPEHCFALIMALIKKIIAYDHAVKAGKWSMSPHFCYLDAPIGDLHGKTITIFGKGTTGEQVAHIARAFGMHVIWGERRNSSEIRPGYTRFEEAIQAADIVSLHCPLTPETHHMIDADILKIMKPSALLINVGRGGLVNEEDLYQALMQNEIAGAGFDVVTTEPMPLSHPFQALTAHPNFILTPHIAWASETAMATLAQQAIDKIDQFIRDYP